MYIQFCYHLFKLVPHEYDDEKIEYTSDYSIINYKNNFKNKANKIP